MLPSLGRCGASSRPDADGPKSSAMRRPGRSEEHGHRTVSRHAEASGLIPALRSRHRSHRSDGGPFAAEGLACDRELHSIETSATSRRSDFSGTSDVRAGARITTTLLHALRVADKRSGWRPSCNQLGMGNRYWWRGVTTFLRRSAQDLGGRTETQTSAPCSTEARRHRRSCALRRRLDVAAIVGRMISLTHNATDMVRSRADACACERPPALRGFVVPGTK